MAAVNRLAEIGRGQVVMADGRSVAELPCPIGGLMSDLAAEEATEAWWTRSPSDRSPR